MNNENTSIHDFDFDLICEYFSSVERQGPGSPEVTLKALEYIPDLTDQSRIADLGCGTGGQTMVLARHTPGNITGIDLFPKFIDIFNRNARNLNLQDRVQGLVGSMDQLPFEDGELDLIWSEGAIYNIGFERGINEWKRFLKPGGYLAVTEATWFTPQRPEEIHQFWMDAYPQIDTVSRKVAQMEAAGYLPIATFMLPQSCWTEDFYKPLVAAQEKFLKKYPGNDTALSLVQNQRHEENLYRQYKEYYGYAFYIGKKR